MNTLIVRPRSPISFSVNQPETLRTILLVSGWREHLLRTCHAQVLCLRTADGALIILIVDVVLVQGEHIARTCALLNSWVPQPELEQAALPW
jgi:hypothetical protein